IDEQVYPLRGIGTHEVMLEGIAERLHPGDQLFLMFYGVHPTFVGTFSRDLLSITVGVEGEVRVPLLTADGRKALPASAIGAPLLPRGICFTATGTEARRGSRVFREDA